ncbi:universal stress protein [Actinomadura macra]|uniref:universal stress protein n=1 Tax=Actinomadura macra TaxID=46164 RepID=UPI0009FE6364|nr:universal stress protein [Actinomadura macra]
MAPFSITDQILVGLDGSAASLAALRWAVAEAELRHAEIVAVRSWRASREWLAPYAVMASRPSPGRERERARRALASDVLAVLGPAPAVKVHQELVYGEPARTLVDRAATVDLLVLGGHRGDGQATPAIGPVGAACLRRAACPVVIVAPGSRREGAHGHRERPADEERTASQPELTLFGPRTDRHGARGRAGRPDRAEEPRTGRASRSGEQRSGEHGDDRRAPLHHPGVARSAAGRAYPR